MGGAPKNPKWDPKTVLSQSATWRSNARCPERWVQPCPSSVAPRFLAKRSGWSKSTGDQRFSLCVHLPGFHFGCRFLTSHLKMKRKLSWRLALGLLLLRSCTFFLGGFAAKIGARQGPWNICDRGALALIALTKDICWSSAFDRVTGQDVRGRSMEPERPRLSAQPASRSLCWKPMLQPALAKCR